MNKSKKLKENITCEAILIVNYNHGYNSLQTAKPGKFNENLTYIAFNQHKKYSIPMQPENSKKKNAAPQY